MRSIISIFSPFNNVRYYDIINYRMKLKNEIASMCGRTFYARGLQSPYMVEPCVAGYPPLF